MKNSRDKRQAAKPTILIVEDHNALRDSLRRWLSSIFPDCNFLEAKTGEDAVALAPDRLPDIVIMDIGLPGINGIEATRHIKGSVPKTHVVMLTIHDVADYKTDASAAGADAYIPKHAMHSELIPVVTKLLSQPDDNMPNVSNMKRKK
jgi:two-component system invasion response regulator UvrY